MSKKILVVEDENGIREYIAETLRDPGFEVRAVESAERAEEELAKSLPDLMLLDVRLPGMNGFDFCQKLRAGAPGRSVPIIFLTSKEEEAHKVLGLEIGGDDYMTKPFSGAELVARVKAVLRRHAPEAEEDVLKGGALVVEAAGRRVRISRKKIDVPLKEFDLLCALLRKKGRVLSRPHLMETVWGGDRDQDTRTVDAHVYRLRRRLGRHGDCIKSVEGMGYKWEDL